MICETGFFNGPLFYWGGNFCFAVKLSPEHIDRDLTA
jgi:hypothetical protein